MSGSTAGTSPSMSVSIGQSPLLSSLRPLHRLPSQSSGKLPVQRAQVRTPETNVLDFKAEMRAACQTLNAQCAARAGTPGAGGNLAQSSSQGLLTGGRPPRLPPPSGGSGGGGARQWSSPATGSASTPVPGGGLIRRCTSGDVSASPAQPSRPLGADHSLGRLGAAGSSSGVGGRMPVPSPGFARPKNCEPMGASYAGKAEAPAAAPAAAAATPSALRPSVFRRAGTPAASASRGAAALTVARPVLPFPEDLLMELIPSPETPPNPARGGWGAELPKPSPCAESGRSRRHTTDGNINLSASQRDALGREGGADEGAAGARLPQPRGILTASSGVWRGAALRPVDVAAAAAAAASVSVSAGPLRRGGTGLDSGGKVFSLLNCRAADRAAAPPPPARIKKRVSWKSEAEPLGRWAETETAVGAAPRKAPSSASSIAADNRSCSSTFP